MIPFLHTKIKKEKEGAMLLLSGGVVCVCLAG